MMGHAPVWILAADFPIQWIVPAIFLVIWALNQVFGREEKAVPPARRDPMGPRPAAPSVPPGRCHGPRRTRQPTMRRGEDEGNSRGGRRTVDDDEVFVIPSADANQSRPSAGGPGRRPTRPRGTGAGGGRRPEAGRPAPPRWARPCHRCLPPRSRFGQMGPPGSTSLLAGRREGRLRRLAPRAVAIAGELRQALILSEVLDRPVAIGRGALRGSQDPDCSLGDRRPRRSASGDRRGRRSHREDQNLQAPEPGRGASRVTRQKSRSPLSPPRPLSRTGRVPGRRTDRRSGPDFSGRGIFSRARDSAIGYPVPKGSRMTPMWSGANGVA